MVRERKDDAGLDVAREGVRSEAARCHAARGRAAFAGLAWALAASAAAAQTTWTVDLLVDENDSGCVVGDCSLREAIAAAGALDTIEFALPGDPPWTLRLSSALAISTTVTISGPGSADLRISGDSDGDGEPDVRLFEVATAGVMVLEGVGLERGISAAGSLRNGGCLRNLGSVTLESVELSECRGWSGTPTTLNGAAGASGGAIWNGDGATLSITGSRLTANVAGGGASSPDGFAAGPAGGSGGALANAGTATILDSTFDANHAGRGGYPYGQGGDGGAIANLSTGVLRLVRSTLASNFSGDETCDTGSTFTDGRGGGIFSAGETAIENSTLSDNQIGDTVVCGSQSARGGGLAVGGGTTRLRNVTLAANRASGQGGGVAREAGVLLLRNSVVADNSSSATTNEDCYASPDTAIDSEGYNVVEVATGCAGSLDGTGDQSGTGAAPLLGPLGDHGGPTATHPLVEASLAIDAGDPDGCLGWDPVASVDTAMPTDQRGEARPTDGDGDTVAVCDAGAYEAPELVPVFHDLDVVVVGSGSVTSAPPGIACPGDCGESYLEGTQVDLAAEAQPGWLFTGWSGDCVGSTTPCTVTLDQPRAVTATFEETPPTWTLEVAIVGDGTVASTAPGIACPGDCSEVYDDGDPVELTATPGAGSLFDAWQGDCAGQGPVCALTMTVDRNTTALFLAEAIFADGFEAGDLCSWDAAQGAPPCP